MDNAGNIITQGFLMAEELHKCTSVQCSREKILVRYLYCVNVSLYIGLTAYIRIRVK